MTDFTPEHYLAAARISNDGCRWFILDDGSVWAESDDDGNSPRAFEPDGQNHRALREALDIRHRITIEWHDPTNRWVSSRRNQGINEIIQTKFDDSITNLMMRNVVALVEAGVVK